jgi:hypothetical protein
VSVPSQSWRISVDGCDDSTTVEMDLTEAEAAVVERVARAITEESSYGCMPTMTLEAKTNG